MKKISIFVACHKPGKVFSNSVYTPIHVGRAVSKYKEEMIDMIGDDTGDNISDKNPYYCEMTAQYWAWKNVHDVEYVGFCHYRRYFDLSVTEDNVDSLFKKKDVILLMIHSKKMVIRELLQFVCIEDFTLFLMVLKKKYPEYEKTTLEYLHNSEFHTKNMMICRKEVFDQYAAWIFDILFEVEKNMKKSPYTRGRRHLAYLAEFFMPVWMIHNRLRIKNTSLIDFPGSRQHRSFLSKANPFFRHLFALIHIPLVRSIMKVPKSFEDMYMSEVLAGFSADGIDPAK